MTFLRRLKLFAIGLGLGLVLVLIFFGSRDWMGWTPQSRVLDGLDSAQVVFSPRVQCQLKCLGIKKEEINDIRKQAKVDFSESNARKQPCPVYHLIIEEESSRLNKLIYQLCEKEKQAELLSISRKGTTCGCG